MAQYSSLLGHAPGWYTRSVTGRRTATYFFENTALKIVQTPRVKPELRRPPVLTEGLEGKLTELAFETDDLDRAHHLAQRRGLKPGDIAHSGCKEMLSGVKKEWKEFSAAPTTCAGIKTRVLQHTPENEFPHTYKPASVCRLDHLVINTPNPERAIAHYGARLGLRFALDRTIEAFNTRFLFFRIGGLTIEVVHKLGNDLNPEEGDKLWGLTWAVDDLAGARERLISYGKEVSDIREGRKPGSHVFTVKSHTLDVPTLFISHAKKVQP